MKKIRPVIQIVFLGVFISLMILKKAQIWMGFIFLSIVLSAFFGRYYCGWACPINTLIRPINWIRKKLGIQRKDVPKVFQSEKLRWGVFILFLVGLGYTIYTIKIGKKFPLPLIIIPMGLATTLFINEKTWHRYLCPWGVLFSLTGRFAKLGIMQKNCYSCSVCEKNCPADAIRVDKNKGAVVDSTHCLLCLECQSSCPINAMSYKKINDI
ncbi:MAG: 4Fe-4S binding protein [Marinisporobacter sp.]|jgi:polyferredoxin|nr:4Fe-4S binding protein [Marinisporobacter sp.]